MLWSALKRHPRYLSPVGSLLAVLLRTELDLRFFGVPDASYGICNERLSGGL